MLVLNIELITRWVKTKKLRTVISDHLLHIIFSVLKVIYCTLLSERSTSKVSSLFYIVGLQYVLVKVWNFNVLCAIYSVSFYHLNWVQNGFVIIQAVWSEFKLQFFCCWWERFLYLLVVAAATTTEIFGRTDVMDDWISRW